MVIDIPFIAATQIHLNSAKETNKVVLNSRGGDFVLSGKGKSDLFIICGYFLVLLLVIFFLVFKRRNV